jgi:hypothetical protein
MKYLCFLVDEYIKRYGVDRLDNFIKARLNGK